MRSLPPGSAAPGSTPSLEDRLGALAAAGPASLGLLLGSFDPPHRGHLWLVERLRRRCQRVLLLIPARHFEKTLRPHQNATFARRLAMLEATLPPGAEAALTREVLFVRLHALLRRRLPEARITLAMGQDTRQKVTRSEAYFRRCGLPWGPAQRRELGLLLRGCLVYDRRAGVPRRLRGLSSTRVRAAARRLHLQGASPATWRGALAGMVPGAVIRQIRRHGLYRPPGAPWPARRPVAATDP